MAEPGKLDLLKAPTVAASFQWSATQWPHSSPRRIAAVDGQEAPLDVPEQQLQQAVRQDRRVDAGDAARRAASARTDRIA